MKQKECSKCKDTDNLYISSKSTNKKGETSFWYICRACNTERCKKYRETTTGRNNIYKAVYKSSGKHRKEVNARKMVCRRVKKGAIIKPKKCSICKLVKKLEGHHKDYSKPLDVEWICRQCHFTCYH